jgi:pyruvate/2-oxoglutarate/acetoin dehydrogenase E1 component
MPQPYCTCLAVKFMYRWSYALMRNRTAIGGTTFAQLGTHVPGLIVLLQVHMKIRNMLHAALQSTDPVILFEYTSY